MTDSDSKENEKAPLDLGLSQLASRENTLDVSSYVADLERTRNRPDPEVAVEDEASTRVCPTGLEQLDASIEVEDWQDVINCAEKNFSDKHENHRVRLWWLHAQLHLNSMPPSLLTAPLQSVGQALQEENDDAEALLFLERIATDLSEELKGSKDYNHAVSVLELLSSLNSIHEDSHREAFDTLIAEQRSRLGPRASRDMKERVKRLEVRYENLFGEEFQEQEEVEESVLEEDSESILPELDDSSRTSASSWYILLLLLLLGSAYWSGIFEGARDRIATVTGETGTSSQEAEVAIAYTIEAPVVKIPDTGIVDVMRKPSLHGILKELDKQLTNPSSIIAQAGSRNTGGSKTVVAQAATATATAGAQQSKKRNAKKTLDMSGPAEPRTVSEIIRDNKQRPDVNPRVPQRLYSGRLRGESRGNTIVSGYPTIPRFGRGQQVVEARGEPYFYRIVYETAVKSAPSDASQTIGYLKIGNKVEVGERIGPWLRIVSSRSRSGYILANTAKPIKAPYS